MKQFFLKCLLVGNDNFTKNTFSPLHFYFLFNLEKSSFGGLGAKRVKPHHFLLSPPLPTKHPSHPYFLQFSNLFFFFFLKSSQPTIHKLLLVMSLWYQNFIIPFSQQMLFPQWECYSQILPCNGEDLNCNAPFFLVTNDNN